MDVSLKCRKCNNNFEAYNFTSYSQLRYCPYCGACILKKQNEALLRKVSDGEIEDIIKEHVLDMLDRCCGVAILAGELAYTAWKMEDCDGVVFYDDYLADCFTMRHGKWVDDALEYVSEHFGDENHYIKMKAECNDRFLTAAFITATEHFLYEQLCIGCDEGGLTKKQIKEIKRLVKTTPYDGEF